MSAEVIFSTSYDDKYPPHNILSSSNSMFWVSTGLYPQEIVLNLPLQKVINEIQISCIGIKKLSIEACENDSAVKFTVQSEQANIPNKNSVQDINCKFNSKSTSKIIKIVIHEGHGFFSCINNVSIK